MTENEYASKMIPMIIDTMPPSTRKRLQVISEVPRFSCVDHMDLLFIDRKKKKMLSVEFKLKNPSGLSYQVYGNKRITGINCLGVINQIKAVKKFYDPDCNICFLKIDDLKKCDGSISRIWSKLRPMYWTDMYNTKYGILYWYGYINHKQFDIENVGMGSCKRLSFFQLYKIAIKNLLNEGIGPEIISKVFGVYSYSSVKKYYDEVIREDKI